MNYTWRYKTPDSYSDVLMRSDGQFLNGLWFEGSRDSSKHIADSEEQFLDIFRETSEWLDIYFGGRNPEFTPEYRIEALSDFRAEVVEEMLKIPFGSLITYGDIAEIIADRRGIDKMSSRAVGGAVGWNPICIIIPCHRVIGTGGSLTGYGGGIKNKIALLTNEGHDMSNFTVPVRGTAL